MNEMLRYILPIVANPANAPRGFRLAMIVWLLLVWADPLLAQQSINARERASFWASKGQSLIRGSQYAEAYTAFQLARSLGAPNMAAQMELAKKRNINSIQFRALLAEARAQASTDPTQSLRLLEYARSKFPDSTSLIKAIGEVANQPDNWYYTLRADSCKASPKFTYLLADTDKTRLYLCQGDSLTLVYTFAERPALRVFSPDDGYLFVTTGKTQKGSLYALKGQKVSLYRSFDQPVLSINFSPNQNPAFGSWLLLDLTNGKTQLVDLSPTKAMFNLSNQVVSKFGIQQNTCKFSPSGRYLIKPNGIWQLGLHDMKPVIKVGQEPWKEYMTFASGRFSDDERHILFIKSGAGTEISMSLTFMQYTLSEQGDSLFYKGESEAYLSMFRERWRPFSFDSKYLSGNNSLYFYDHNQWQLLRPVTKPNNPVHKPQYESQRFQSRFSPDSTHLLLEAPGPNENQIVQLWRLDGSERHLVHEFADKTSLTEDVFSANGTYLLARHDATDKLWRIDKDTVSLIHTFAQGSRPSNTFDADGYPLSSTCFSPNNQYLLTYSPNSEDADSLWQIQVNDNHCRIVPMRGFNTRLNQARTRFSPNGKWLLTEGSGSQPAHLWNLTEQRVELRQTLKPKLTQAMFSPKGNYLLTNSEGGGFFWNVSNRALTPIDSVQGFNTIESINRFRFSPDERHVTYTQLTPEKVSNVSWLYSLHPDGLVPIRKDHALRFVFALLPGNPSARMDTYQTGKFSPDGSHWLQSQLVQVLNNEETVVRPNTLWNLTAAGLAFDSRLTGHVDNYNVIGEHTPGEDRMHSEPAALFSRDSRFLMTTESGRLQFYQLGSGTTGRPIPGPSVAGRPVRGFPLHTSANTDYWFIQPNYYYQESPPQEEADRYYALYGNGISNTPDTAQIWRRSGSGWKLIARFSSFLDNTNQLWQNNRRQSWFSTLGNYLLVPTTRSTMTTLFSLMGDNLRPVAHLNARLLNAALISPNPTNGREVCVLYTNTQQQTYLLQYGPGEATRTIPLGFGTLEHPPQSGGRYIWWTRKLDASQQTVELLDLTSGQTLVRIPFGSVLDYTIRPDGNVWVVSTAGARLIRSPDEVLRWLKQAPLAPFAPELRQAFTFL